MNPLILAAILVALILAVFFLFFRRIKDIASRIFLFILNSMGGVILLLLLKYVFGVEIPLNLATTISVVIFGLPALGCLLILHYMGMI